MRLFSAVAARAPAAAGLRPHTTYGGAGMRSSFRTLMVVTVGDGLAAVRHLLQQLELLFRLLPGSVSFFCQFFLVAYSRTVPAVYK